MPLDSRVIDRLFEVMHVRYGGAFMAQWPDTDPAIIKADWADVLSAYGCKLNALKWAIDNLPAKPMNAIAFRELARSMPDDPVKFLPPIKADAQKVAEAIADAKKAASGWPMTPAQSVISRILDIAEGRNEMSRAQSDFLRVCIKMLRSNDPLRSRLLRHGIGEVDLQSS